MSVISKFSSQNFSQVQEFLLAKDAKGNLQNLKLAERYSALDQAVKLYAEKQCSAEEYLALKPNWQAKLISGATKKSQALENPVAARANAKELKNRVREMTSEAEFTVRSKEIIGQIENLKSIGEAFEREHAALIEKKDAALMTLSEELRDVKKGETEANRRNEHLSKELQGTQNAALILKGQIEENSRTIEGLHHELKELQAFSKSEISKQAETITGLANELQRVNTQMQASQLQASSLEGKVQELTKEKGGLEGEISSIQQKLETAVKDLEAALQKATTQETSYSQKAEKLQEDIRGLEAANERLKAELELTGSTSKGMLNQKDLTIKSLQATVQANEKKIEELNAQLEKTNKDSRALISEEKKLVAELQAQNAKISSALEKALSEGLIQEEEISGFKNAMADLQKANEGLSLLVGRFEAENKEQKILLQQKDDKIAHLTKEVKKKNVLIEKLQGIVKFLSEALRDLAKILGLKLSFSHKNGPTIEQVEQIKTAAQRAADYRSKAANQKAFDELDATIAQQARALDKKDALIAEQEKKNLALQQRIEELMKEKLEMPSIASSNSEESEDSLQKKAIEENHRKMIAQFKEVLAQKASAADGKEKEVVVDPILDSESEASAQQKVIDDQKLLIEKLEQEIEQSRIAAAKENLARLEKKFEKTTGKLKAIAEEEKKSSWFWWL